MNNRDYYAIYIFNIISFLFGYENLKENREQSKHNDVQAANNAQAEYLLNEINKRFDEQNKILEEQNIILNKLLERMDNAPKL